MFTKNIGLAAVAMCLAGCAEEGGNFPRIGAAGAPAQGSTAPAAIEHVARASYAWAGATGTNLLMLLLLIALPYAVFVLIPRFAAGEAETVIEGVFIAGIAGLVVALTDAPLEPWFAGFIPAGIAVMLLGKGWAKFALFVALDIVLVVWVLVKVDQWIEAQNFWLRFMVFVAIVIAFLIGAAAKKTAASAH